MQAWVKVQLFWEGYKNLHNLPYGFDVYLVNVKTIGQIVQIFVVFSEKLNFNKTENRRHNFFDDSIWGGIGNEKNEVII